MIIVVRPDATEEQVDHIIKKIKDHGLQAHVSKGTERTIIGAIGDEAILQSLPLEAIPGVEKVLPDPEALQAREQGVPEGEHGHQRAADNRSAASASRSWPVPARSRTRRCSWRSPRK